MEGAWRVCLPFEGYWEDLLNDLDTRKIEHFWQLLEVLLFDRELQNTTRHMPIAGEASSVMLIKVAKNSTLIFVVQIRSEENNYQMVDEHKAKCYLDVLAELNIGMVMI